MTKHNLEGGAGKSLVMVRICSPSLYVMFCHLPDSGRHVTSVFQGLSLSRSRGREGEDPGNEVGLPIVVAPGCLGHPTSTVSVRVTMLFIEGEA